jgi:putative transposase
MKVKRAYRFRFYPSEEQKQILAQTFGCVRFSYNRMLRIRTDAWYNEQKRIGYHETSALLTELKKQEDTKFLNEVSCIPVQQSLRHLQAAFNNFFAKKAKYPNFKKKDAKQSAEYTTSGFKWDGLVLRIAKMNEPLKIRFSRELPKAAKITTVTVSKDCSGRYFVSMLCDDCVAPKSPVTNKVGIDLGLSHFAVLSSGEKIDAPKFFRKHEIRLATLQKRLAKKKKGSNNREKAKLKVAKIHAKITDSRKDFLHKLSTRIVNENQVICVETLSVKNMQRNRCLSKSISDAGWSEFVKQLEYKSLWSGRQLVGVDKWYPSSKRCNRCGYTMSKLPLHIREWKCPECETLHDRDENASRNILAAGIAVLACGEAVSPSITC